MTTAASTVIEGDYPYVPEGLVVGPDAMGVDYQTQIDGIPLSILFPVLSADPARKPIDQVVSAPVFRFLATSTAAQWGFVTTSHLSSQIERVGVRFEAAGDPAALSEFGRRIDATMDAWWARAASWIDCYSELDMLGHGRKSGVLGIKLRLKTPSGSVLSWMTTTTARLPHLIRIPDQHAIRRAFALAASGTDLPDMWTYLREARSWAAAEQYRRAAIDACTAAEIALAAYGRRLSPTPATERRINRCRGIVALFDVVESLAPTGSLPMRVEVQDEVASVRNKAAHAGVTPSATVGLRTVEIASAIVAAAIPPAELEAMGDRAIAALPI